MRDQQHAALLRTLLEADPEPLPDQSGSSQDDTHLLQMLLAQAPAPVHAPSLFQRQRRWFVGAGLTLLIALGLFGIYALGSTALSLLTIRRNVQAMQVSPVAQEPTLAAIVLHTSITPSPTPTLIVPPTEVPSVVIGQYRGLVPTVPFAPVDATAAALSPLLERAVDPATVATLTPLPIGSVATSRVLPSLTLPPTGVPLPTGTVRPQQSGSSGTATLLGAPHADELSIRAYTPSPAQESLTVLVLGMDQRPEESFPARTDAIIVARAEPDTRRVALLSLPRDLIVPIVGVGSDRINAAYVYGELNPHLGGGTAVARQTVSDLLGIPIDHVVLVNFEGFMGAIDSIGGVTIDVQAELYDPQYPTMNYGYTVAHFLPGEQHMDGATALMYSRVRHMDSDFERMRRQQQVVVAMLQQLREQHAVRQLRTIATLTTALRDYIQTDVPQDRMIDLAWAFRDMNPESIERYTLNENMVSMYVLPGDPYAQFALPGAIEALSHQLLYGPAADTLSDGE